MAGTLRKPWPRFVAAINGAKKGDRIEVGVAWRARRGWGPYWKLGETVVYLGADEVRQILEGYHREGYRLRRRVPAERMGHIFGEFRRAIADSERDNAAGVVPAVAEVSA